VACYEFGITVDFPQEAITYLIVWHCFLDACPKCQNLNGYPFVIEGADLPPTLMHPQYGAVWDLQNDVSLTHLHCRCNIEIFVHVYWDKIPIIYELRQELNMPPLNLEVISDMSKLNELKTGLEGLKGSIVEVSDSLRTFTILAARAGLPSEISQSLILLRQLKLAIEEPSALAGLGIIGLEFAALRWGPDLFLRAVGVEPNTAQILTDWQKKQQQELEVWQMHLRRPHY